jgi:hypothetical protein
MFTPNAAKELGFTADDSKKQSNDNNGTEHNDRCDS